MILINDFRRVCREIKTNNTEIPTWIIVVYYVIMLPIGLIIKLPLWIYKLINTGMLYWAKNVRD
jgi:hypothetical protein